MNEIRCCLIFETGWSMEYVGRVLFPDALMLWDYLVRNPPASWLVAGYLDYKAPDRSTRAPEKTPLTQAEQLVLQNVNPASGSIAPQPVRPFATLPAGVQAELIALVKSHG